jgi:superfamily II DNA/RNA helicase
MEKNNKIKNILENIGISMLNEMQEAALQAIKEESELILIAPTGTGKSLAFLLPIYERMVEENKNVQALIITPTRELAIQLQHVWQRMRTGFKVNSCYGGHSMSVEVKSLNQAPALLIGTPGRLLDHMDRGTFDQRKIDILVLDEFDKSLAMGFQNQMAQIIKTLSGLKKKVLVSATAKWQIPEFVGVSKPVTLHVPLVGEQIKEHLQLKIIYGQTFDKLNLLFELLCYVGSSPSLIFCNQRGVAEEVGYRLAEKGIDCGCFHGGMSQVDREKALISFRNGSIRFLIATDLAARGLDIPEVSNVIHFEVPSKHTEWLHRNGRTARMQANGNAFLILGKKEPLPSYLSVPAEPFKIPVSTIVPKPSPWVTLHVSGGKKDKIRKTDIVGFFMKKGGLDIHEIGIIESMDFMSFVAVDKSKVEDLLHKVKNEKLKGKKYQIRRAG